MRLWLFLYKHDIVKAFKLLIPIALILFILGRLPQILKYISLSSLDAETIGVVDSIYTKKSRQETLEGSRLVEKYYIIKYHFEVCDLIIRKSESIDKSGITFQEINKLNSLQPGDSINIKYDSDNIDKSLVALK